MPRPTSTQLARVSPRRRMASARVQRRSAGQAAVEFSFTFVLFLLCLFGSISAALWSIESMATVSALENGLRVGAATVGPNTSAAITNAENNPGSTGVTFKTIRNRLSSSLFATKIVAKCPAKRSPNTVDVCIRSTAYPVAGYNSTLVEIDINGCAPNLIPFGFNNCSSGVAISAYGAVPGLKFSK